MTQFSSLYSARLDEELGSADSTVLFTTARRKSAVNKGLVEFARLTKCFVKRSSITIAGGTAEYDLNSTLVIPAGDFTEFGVEQVQFVYTDASSNVTVLAGDDLPRRDIDWLNRYEPGWQVSTVASSVSQLPAMYYDRWENGARYLGFWPTPFTGSSASAKAYVPYVATPQPITVDTVEPFTVGSAVRGDLRPYHQAAVHFAAHQLEKLRRDDQASMGQLQKFIAYVTQYFQDHKRQKNGAALTFGRSYFTTRSAVQDPRT